MSGTSCDGLDVVLVEIRDGGTDRDPGSNRRPSTMVEAMADRMRDFSGLTDPEALRLEQEWTGWVGPDRLWCPFGSGSGVPPHRPASAATPGTTSQADGARGPLGTERPASRTLALPVVVDYRSADVAAGGQGSAPCAAVRLGRLVRPWRLSQPRGHCQPHPAAAVGRRPHQSGGPVRGESAAQPTGPAKTGKAFDRGGEDGPSGAWSSQTP